MGECLVGDYINYYSNGNIKDICCYEDGKKNGNYSEYHNNGKLKTQGSYENNYKIGYEYKYDIDGNLIEKIFVDDNQTKEYIEDSFTH
jgi:antitoxin component YwqK of YwqJK toxin-antitoxin module